MDNQPVIIKAGKPNCICCKKLIYSAAGDEDPFEIPRGVLFIGGGNFGSAIIDSAVDGHYIAVIICDACVLKNRQYVQEYQNQNGGFCQSPSDPPHTLDDTARDLEEGKYTI